MTGIASNLARLVRVEEPAEEPVSLTQAKLWLRVDGAEDDDLITELIKAARSVFEDITGRTLVETSYRAEWDGLPRCGTYIGAGISREIRLPRGPLVAEDPVSAVKYLDEDGDEQTLDAAAYTVDTARDANQFPRLWLNEDYSWPTLGRFPGALRCEFSAGYGDAAAVPAEIKVCLKLILAHLYENRTPVNIGNIVNELPFSLTSLIEMHRLQSLV